MLTGIDLRVKKRRRGWVIERKTFFGWRHVVSAAGLNTPWHYESPESAIEDMKELVAKELKQNITN